MNLATFILTNLENILEKWEAARRPESHPRQVESPGIRRDDAGELLRAIARDLEASRTPGQREVAKPDRSYARLDIEAAADRHGTGRAKLGFTLDQMIAEFPLLRSCVTSLWLKETPRMTADDIDDLVRFNASVDVALCESVSQYVARINRSRELFLGILGHDLKDPLSAIIMSADLLAELPREEDRRREIAARIHSIGTRMQHMISDLLDYTRSRLGGGMPIEPHSVDLREVVQAAADEVTTSHPERSVHIEVSGDLHGKWDPRRIGQALSNLLGNAVHHGQPKTTIDVLAHGDAVEVSLAVHNEGAPIPPERRTAIFDPLSTPDERERLRAHDPDHLGLGLYITKEIVRSHHGRIDIDSSADRGTTFTIHLPRESADTR